MKRITHDLCPLTIEFEVEVNVLVVRLVRHHTGTELRLIQEKCLLIASVPNREHRPIRCHDLRGVSIPHHGEVIGASFYMQSQ